ncbi:MAG: hypothetical protein MI922_09365, partial [Bacteroidales bacterium]|nr:hypothetical protein [Bacteroidales bacterium]
QLNQSLEGIIGCWNFNYIDDAPYGTGDESGEHEHGVSTSEYYAYFNGGTLTEGIAGQGYKLDGLNDYLWIKDQPKFSNLDSITVMLWLKAKQQSFSDNNMVMGQWDTNQSNSMFQMNLKVNNGFGFAVSDGINEYEIVADANSLDPNTWMHLAGMYDNNSGQMQLYINGELHKEQAQTIALNDSSEHIYIGKDPNGYLEATVDEIAIFDRAGTTNEMASLYFDSFSGHNYGYPWFADPAGGDYRLQSRFGRFAGQSDPNDPATINWVYDSVNSPGIDWGDPNDAVGLEILPNGNRINAGAYGGTIYASRGLWDTNKDRMIDMDDLTVLAENWLAGISSADLNQDNETDMTDFSLIGKQWLQALPYNWANGSINSPVMAMAMSEPEMAGMAMQSSMAATYEAPYNNAQYQAELLE